MQLNGQWTIIAVHFHYHFTYIRCGLTQSGLIYSIVQRASNFSLLFVFSLSIWLSLLLIALSLTLSCVPHAQRRKSDELLTNIYRFFVSARLPWLRLVFVCFLMDIERFPRVVSLTFSFGPFVSGACGRSSGTMTCKACRHTGMGEH